MIRGTAARYAFAACLSASVVDLLVVDLVLGPVALQPEAAPRPEVEAPKHVEPPQAGASVSAVAGASASASPAATSGSGARPRIVARFDSEQPTADDQDLRALAEEMLADTSTSIVLEGHTDQRGDPARNQALGLERAKWAQNKLVELGVSASRIAVVGVGAERPLDVSDDDAAVAANRRVELRWISGPPSREHRDN